MGDKRAMKIAGVAAAMFAVGCIALVTPASSQSLTDRFKSLFGGKPDEPAQSAAPADPSEGQIEESCPPVSIRAGASTYAVGASGKAATGNDVRFQATITKTRAIAPRRAAKSPPASAFRAASLPARPGRRRRSRFRCASRWCRAVCRRR